MSIENEKLEEMNGDFLRIKYDFGDLPKTKEELSNRIRESDREISVNELTEILGSTVKHDDENKVITFLSMLCTYTDADQVNLGFLAESSTGKSYIPLELSWYFPKNDVIKLGYASPTAFFHEWGAMLPDPYDEDKKIVLVDLHQKLLIFLDQPHSELLQRLRPLLSHDEKRIVVKITDRTQKSGHRTKTVYVEGYPTVIFCSAKMKMDEQEKTRMLLLSPEINEAKLKEAITLKIERESDRAAFQKRMEEDPRRVFLVNRVNSIRMMKIKHVLIPEALRKNIYEKFTDGQQLQARHQRDISKLLAIIKGFALLNYRHRKQTEDSITVNEIDVQTGFRLFRTVSNANELGLAPETYDIYQTLHPKMKEGVSKKEFKKLFYEKYGKLLGSKRANEILELWGIAGLITEIPDPDDRRSKKYIPQGVGGSTTPKTDNEEYIGETKEEIDHKKNKVSSKQDTPTPSDIYISENRVSNLQQRTKEFRNS